MSFNKRLIQFLSCAALMLTANAQSQNSNDGSRGFIRLMNAVGVGSGELEFRINGEKVRDKGYRLGDVTGGIARKPASYQISFHRTGIESGETKLNVLKDETTTLIPFAEFVPATESKPEHWTIRILRLKQSDSREKSTATVINLTRKPELSVRIQQKDGTWTPMHIARLALERAPILQRSGYVSIQAESQDLQPLSVGSSGNYVAVIYEDADGKICSENFQDHKYLSFE